MSLILKRRRKVNNKGITLVELVCAIAIIAILSVSVATIMIVSSKTYAKGSVEIALQEEAQLLSNQVERLVQFALTATNDGGDTSTLIIKQAASGTTYKLVHNSSTKEISYTDESTGNSGLMASDIDTVTYDVTDFTTDGVVKMYVVAKKGDSQFAGNFTISSRNVPKMNAIPGGDITMTLTEAYVLEPKQTQPLTAQMSDGSGIDWSMAGNTDSNTILGTDPSTGKKTIQIGTDEKASIIYLTADSQRKMPDGSTPLVEKTVTIYIRRVDDIELDYTNDTKGNKEKTVRSGDTYTITAGIKDQSETGGKYYLNDMSSLIDDPGYKKEDGTDGIYKTVSPKDILWNVDVIIKGVSVYDSVNHKGKDIYSYYSDSYVTLSPVESVYSAGPKLQLKLNFDMESGDQIIVTAKAKHTLGGIEKTVSGSTYTEQTNIMTSAYANVNKKWILYKDVYKYNGAGFDRASDTKQGDVYVDNIINILRAYYGDALVNSESWNSESILRSHRFREIVLNEAGEIVSTGMWTNWRYLGSSPEQDRGNDLNMRPAATASLDCDKSYQVQLRLFVLDSAGNEKYPIPGVTEESEYIVSGIVNPVSISLDSSGIFSDSLGGDFNVAAGRDISISRGTVKYIKNDADKMLLQFKVQRKNESGNWEDVSSFEDYNNFTDYNAVYLRINNNSSGTDGINAVTFHRKGNYRVMMSHIKVPYTKYVPSADKYVDTGLTKDYTYYDETTGKGIYYFNVAENSTKWKEKFVEYHGNVYRADQYFVCGDTLYEISKYNKTEEWDGSINQLMYFSITGSHGDLFVAENRVDFVHYTYSFKGSDPKTFTLNGTTYKTRDEMNNAGLPAVVKKFIKEKTGW